MLVHRRYHQRHDEQELCVIGGAFARLEDVVSEVGHQRPVVMLAAAVHSRKGFLVQQTGHAVLRRHFAHDLHGELVLIRRHVDGGVDGSKLVLRGGDFVVLGLGKHPQLPQFLVQILHERRHAGFDRAEVVVLKFLTFGRSRAEERPARVHQVPPLHESRGVDEEILLFRTDGGDELHRLSAEEMQEFDALAAHRLHGTEQGSFLVESLSVVATKRRGDAQRPVLYERVGSGIPCGVAPRLEGGAQPAAGERAGVGFTLDQLLAAELHDHTAVRGGSDEGIVLLGGKSRHGLEPVSKVRHSFLDSPIFHRTRDDVCGLEGQGTVVLTAFPELFIGAFRQSLAHDFVAEYHAAEQFRHYHNVLLLRARDAKFMIIILDYPRYGKFFCIVPRPNAAACRGLSLPHIPRK